MIRTIANRIGRLPAPLHVTARCLSSVGSAASSSPDSPPQAAEPRVIVSGADKNGIASMVLKNGAVNTLTKEFLGDIVAGIKKAESDKSCKALVITSAAKVFSSGFDLTVMYRPDKDRARAFWSSCQALFTALYGSRLATICSMSNHAIAGGCILALMCDVRVLAEGARIGLNESEFGIAAPAWTACMLKHTVGTRHAERSLCLGTLYEADMAAHIGLVDLVCRKENLSAETYKEAMRWAAVPGRALNKMLMREQLLGSLETPEARELDFLAFYDIISNPKIQAMIATYVEHLKAKKK